MTTLFNKGDELIGNKIICEARQIKGHKIINKTGRHKTQRIILKDNAKCTIIVKARYIGK